jgi:hypothetical protein
MLEREHKSGDTVWCLETGNFEYLTDVKNGRPIFHFNFDNALQFQSRATAESFQDEYSLHYLVIIDHLYI